jgi:hypothetical protein
MQNRQKKFKHYENSRDTGRTFQALVTTMKIQGKARLRLSKLAKQMLYIKYWEHKKKKKKTLKSERSAFRQMKCSHWLLPYVTIFSDFIQCSNMKFRRAKSVN